MPKKENKNKRHITIITFLQSLYLTGSSYISNDLFSSASACAFGFLFSFIPIIMMILVILFRILHASPETVTGFLSSFKILTDTFDVNGIVNSILSIKKITNFEIVIGLSIIWMARRFFSSVMQGMKSIFMQASPSRPLFSQILIFTGEAILIILTATVIFARISFNTIQRIPVLSFIESKFSFLFNQFNSLIISITPFILIFILILLCYKAESGTKPKWSTCIIAAAGCSFSFFAFQKLMKLFINVNKYNIIYGVLSNVIVILLEVYFFFMIFLFFAQYVFVSQFFDELLLGELYILPTHDDTRLFASIKRMLFIRPDFLLKKDINVIHCKKGEFIYRNGDISDDTFYLSKGTVQILRKNNISFLVRGAFFGEESCILNETRNQDVMAYTDVELVRIPSETFLLLISKNPVANKKALTQISSYFAKVYGRK